MPENIEILSGNDTAARGAIAAGCTFFAGYPITPSSEIAETMSRVMPRIGGVFLQMEDEIASIAAIIGASLTGRKAMTATSGPGFSLMQENLGYAAMAEIPIVIVNIMRGGPSTGLPTKSSQADLMQARWGSHGDYRLISLAPAGVLEMFHCMIKAFNLAEEFRTPALVLGDEIVGHMSENVRLPEIKQKDLFRRAKPKNISEKYRPYDYDLSCPGKEFPSFGEGFRYNVTGLTHDIEGIPSNKNEIIDQCHNRILKKIDNNLDRLLWYDEIMTEDADVLIVSFGSTARSAKSAVSMLRKKGIAAGLFRPVIVWPFPYDHLFGPANRAKIVVVPEANDGQMAGEVAKLIGRTKPLIKINRLDGEVIAPLDIVQVVEKAVKQ